MGAPWERRPVAARRFLIEVDLVCADDLGDESLAGALTQLSTAGLHGMVAAIRTVALDGKVFRADLTGPVERVKPPPDPKLDQALREAERLIASLRSMIPTDRHINAVA